MSTFAWISFSQQKSIELFSITRSRLKKRYPQIKDRFFYPLLTISQTCQQKIVSIVFIDIILHVAINHVDGNISFDDDWLGHCRVDCREQVYSKEYGWTVRFVDLFRFNATCVLLF